MNATAAQRLSWTRFSHHRYLKRFCIAGLAVLGLVFGGPLSWLEQALVFAEGELIDVGALPPAVRGGAAENTLAVPTGEMSLPDILEDLERQLILRAYEKSGGVKTECARLLGIKTSALYYKLEKYGIGTIESRGDKHVAATEGEPPGEAMLGDGPVSGEPKAR